MMRSATTTSEAQREAWEWKDTIVRQVRGLPTEKALSTILDGAARNALVARPLADYFRCEH